MMMMLLTPPSVSLYYIVLYYRDVTRADALVTSLIIPRTNNPLIQQRNILPWIG